MVDEMEPKLIGVYSHQHPHNYLSCHMPDEAEESHFMKDESLWAIWFVEHIGENFLHACMILFVCFIFSLLLSGKMLCALIQAADCSLNV